LFRDSITRLTIILRTEKWRIIPLLNDRLRYYIWALRLKILGMKLGKGTLVRFPISYRYPNNIKIGQNVLIGEYAFLVAGPNSTITIGNDTKLAANVYVITTMHNYEDTKTPIRLQGNTEKDVTIGKDCWIGRGVTILQGVKIGDGAVVAAGAVVTADVEPYAVVGGIPASFIRRRGQRKDSGDMLRMTDIRG